jgi:hypothetical protein
LELEKAAKHGAQHGVKIKTPWDSADGYDRVDLGPDGADVRMKLDGLASLARELAAPGADWARAAA